MAEKETIVVMLGEQLGGAVMRNLLGARDKILLAEQSLRGFEDRPIFEKEREMLDKIHDMIDALETRLLRPIPWSPAPALDPTSSSGE